MSAVVAVTLFSLLLVTGCSDYEKLNGVWEGGDIAVKFKEGEGNFARIDSGSGWDKVRKNGYVKIGSRKFNADGSFPKWGCEELTYNPIRYSITDWSSAWKRCTITMDEDGQTITVYTPDANPQYTFYTRK